MRNFKDHILEKLKVTSKVGEYKTPTFREYYDLLDEYCKTNNEKFLDLNRVFNFDDNLLPKCEYNKKRVIFTLRPEYSNKDIIIKTYDLDLEKSVFYAAYDAGTMDEEVDFIEDEDIEQIVKYMRERIKFK